MRWTPQQLEEYQAKRQSWTEVCGEEHLTGSPHKADEGPESVLSDKIKFHCKEKGWPCLCIPKWATRLKAVRRWLPLGWVD